MAAGGIPRPDRHSSPFSFPGNGCPGCTWLIFIAPSRESAPGFREPQCCAVLIRSLLPNISTQLTATIARCLTLPDCSELFRQPPKTQSRPCINNLSPSYSVNVSHNTAARERTHTHTHTHSGGLLHPGQDPDFLHLDDMRAPNSHTHTHTHINTTPSVRIPGEE